MCALAHYLEAEGVATVLIGLVPQHVERMKPPRALNVPFELGRPLGEPGDVGFQQAVLRATLALLDETSGPVVRHYDIEAPSAMPVAEWACPVSFPQASSGSSELDGLLAETQLLTPWFDRALARRGQSMTGTANLEIAEICRLMWTLIKGDSTDELLPADTDTRFGDRVKLAIEDLKAFYAEAALEQPNPGSATQVQQWFWEETLAGKLIFDLRTACWDHTDSVLQAHARFTFIPAARARVWDARNEATG